MRKTTSESTTENSSLLEENFQNILCLTSKERDYGRRKDRQKEGCLEERVLQQQHPQVKGRP